MSFKRCVGAPVVIVLAMGLLLSGNIACSSKKAPAEGTPAAGQEAAPVSQELVIKEGLNDVSGTVKSALGGYFYISQLPGFDLAAIGGFDAATLVDKEVKAQVLFSRETPSLLIAQSIGIMENGQLRNVFTSTEKNPPADFFSQQKRAGFAELVISGPTKTADWEGKGQGKVLGKLNAATEKTPVAISLSNDKGQETGRILVDNITPYAQYSLKKLRLFDKFWFYLNIKETVPANPRIRTKELFHAEVVFSGLY